MRSLSIKPSPLLAVLVLLVTAFLLSVVPVSAKTALGGSSFNLGDALEKVGSNALTLLENNLYCRKRASGNCDGSEGSKGLLHSDLSKKARAYLDDVQKQTGVKVPSNQRDLLADNVRNNQYTKLPKEQAAVHRKNFNKNKNKLISEWETQTGQKWPRYNEDVVSKNGTVTRKAGQPYDAHHLIESSHGGPNQWWNIHPARFPDQHQGGIHRSGSPARDLFSGGNEK